MFRGDTKHGEETKIKKQMEEKHSILEDIKAEEVEAPYIQKLFTNITDGVIEAAFVVAFYLLAPQETILSLFDISPYMRYVIVLPFIFGYRLISILPFGKTIGMLICRTKYLNDKLLPLSPKERLISVFLTRTSGIKYYKE
jgi:uncharacterized RDD family membrane protein YckC